MRVPRPAAGMITTTFMAGCQYTRGERMDSNHAESIPPVDASHFRRISFPFGLKHKSQAEYEVFLQ